jgi:hypothetical protein
VTVDRCVVCDLELAGDRVARLVDMQPVEVCGRCDQWTDRNPRQTVAIVTARRNGWRFALAQLRLAPWARELAEPVLNRSPGRCPVVVCDEPCDALTCVCAPCGCDGCRDRARRAAEDPPLPVRLRRARAEGEPVVEELEREAGGG